MLIGNKLFPYPILHNQSSNPAYKNSSFRLCFDTKEDGNLNVINGKIRLNNAYFVLDNKELKDLYNAGMVSTYCIIECSSTVFRNREILFETPHTIEIPINDLKDQVTISAFVIANDNIKSYYSDDFGEDYSGYKFDIEKYDILAADDGIRFNVDLDETDDNKVSSIFNIVKKEDAGEEISYLEDGNKINIYMSVEHRRQYDGMKSNPVFNYVFFSMLVVPVLSSCIQNIINNLNDVEAIDDIREQHGWFGSIQKRFLFLKGREMEIDDLKNLNPFSFAQELMDYSTGKGMGDFYHLVIPDKKEEDEDE